MEIVVLNICGKFGTGAGSANNQRNKGRSANQTAAQQLQSFGSADKSANVCFSIEAQGSPAALPHEYSALYESPAEYAKSCAPA